MRFLNSKFSKIILLLLFSLTSMVASAQQVEEFVLIRENAYILNPALSGTKGFLAGTMTFRKEFTRIDRSPYTTYLGLEGQIANRNIGLGGYVIHDQTGPTGQTGFGISGAYQIKLGKQRSYEEVANYNTSKTHMLTFGVGVNMMQYRLNGNELHPDMQNDPELFNVKSAQYFPDASLGLYYQWGEKLYTGISVPQLLGINIKYVTSNGKSEIRKVQHLNFLIGGKIPFGETEKIALAPAGALRWVRNAPIQADLGLRMIFLKTFWVGATYRTNSKIITDIGVEIKGIGRLCYANGIETKDYKNMGMSHEVTLAFMIPDKKQDMQILNLRFK